MNLHGKNIIGSALSSEGKLTYKAFCPKENIELPELFYSATANEVDLAAQKAVKAYAIYKNIPGKIKAVFLRNIADNIDMLGFSLIERAMLETGLSEGRLTGERNRTTGHLRMFASLLEEGSWCDAKIDTAIPDRKPLPRADIRKMLRPIGPIVVYGSSNFPLAYSTAGGDTTSALAAGCPVIVKVHPCHPGTNELVATAIINAALKSGMPDGVFSSLHAIDNATSEAFVSHPLVKAVGFTGSYIGGKHLFDVAQQREEPIPFFAEMGSINPIILLPDKLAADTKLVAAQIAASVTLGAGQFCTNPGIIVTLSGKATEEFIALLGAQIKTSLPETMLSSKIKKSFAEKSELTITNEGTKIVARSDQVDGVLEGRPTIARVEGKKFIANPKLAEEVFGPFSLIVVCKDNDELAAVIKSFKGQLTASIYCSQKDIVECKQQISDIQEFAGRIIFNGVPTGVEVCNAMQHGGPFPASTDSRFTSVGVDAIKRFVRPVAYQNAPEIYLPDELKDENPLAIWRTLNGILSRDKSNM